MVVMELFLVIHRKAFKVLLIQMLRSQLNLKLQSMQVWLWLMMKQLL